MRERKKKANHNELHSLCVAEGRKALGREPDFTLWPNTVVTISNGIPISKPGLCEGATDLIGILAPHGRLVAVEQKTGSGAPTEKQAMFMDLVRKRGGFACVISCQTLEEAAPLYRAALERARAGASE